MSIATEIERIISAKTGLKAELLSRGADVNNLRINDYASKLREMMYCIQGECTPEEDTVYFNVNGLRFCPEILVAFNREMHTTNLTEAVSLVVLTKGSTSSIRYRRADGQVHHANVSAVSSVVSWSDTGCTVIMPESSGFFKAGYTYEYYVLGRAL